MRHKNNTVDDSRIEDYMTLTTVTMNFKNSVLDIAKKMLAENISSIAITDDGGKLLASLQNVI
jgi:predicted transcriptional regulator